MCAWFACISVPHSCSAMEDRKGPKIPIHSCEPLCGCWESKIGSLEELSLLLTAESPPHFRAVCNLLFLAEINTRTK